MSPTASFVMCQLFSTRSRNGRAELTPGAEEMDPEVRANLQRLGYLPADGAKEGGDSDFIPLMSK